MLVNLLRALLRCMVPCVHGSEAVIADCKAREREKCFVKMARVAGVEGAFLGPHEHAAEGPERSGEEMLSDLLTHVDEGAHGEQSVIACVRLCAW